MRLDDALGFNVRHEAAVVADGVFHGLEAAVWQQHLRRTGLDEAALIAAKGSAHFKNYF